MSTANTIGLKVFGNGQLVAPAAFIAWYRCSYVMMHLFSDTQKELVLCIRSARIQNLEADLWF